MAALSQLAHTIDMPGQIDCRFVCPAAVKLDGLAVFVRLQFGGAALASGAGRMPMMASIRMKDSRTFVRCKHLKSTAYMTST